MLFRSPTPISRSEISVGSGSGNPFTCHSPSCIHIWNILPGALTNATNYTTFKKEIKHYLNLGKGDTEINRLFYNSHDAWFPRKNPHTN